MSTDTTPRRMEYMRLSDIPEAEANPKRHADEQIAASIGRFGFADASILDERTGRLIAGHGRRRDLLRRQAEGKEPPEGILLDDDGEWMMPVQRGWASRSDDDAAAFLVGHNRTTELGGWDNQELVDLLAGIDDLDGTGYTEADLAQLAGDTELPDDDDMGDAPIDDIPVVYGVVIECADEEEQADLLERMIAEGRTVRALM